MSEINFPLEKTYFIAYNENDNNVHYGVINPDQCMGTGKENIFSTIVEQVYIDELLKFNINYQDTLPITGITDNLNIPTGLTINF